MCEAWKTEEYSSWAAVSYVIPDACHGTCYHDPISAAPTVSPTASPTVSPTAAPTDAPTPHPCEDGSHGCDQVEGGICYKAVGSNFTCGCKTGYWESSVSPHACTKNTVSPTDSPTASPTRVCPVGWFTINNKCFSPPEKTSERLAYGQAGFPPGATSYCQNLAAGAHIMTREEAEEFLASPEGGNDACDSKNRNCGKPLGMPYGYTSTTSHYQGMRIWLTNHGWDTPQAHRNNRWFSCVNA